MFKLIFKKNIYGDRQGFTLVETLVAVAILTSAVAGPLTFAIRNISAAAVAQDQLVAFQLAQEPFEYIRNIRDSNLLTNVGGVSVDWLNGLDDCSEAEGCYIDMLDRDAKGKGIIKKCSDAPEAKCPVLKFKEGLGYQYADGPDSVFKRTIKIDKTFNDGEEAQITVDVEWTGRYGDRKITLQNNIYNWR